jgi:hypothetical protein
MDRLQGPGVGRKKATFALDCRIAGAIRNGRN